MYLNIILLININEQITSNFQTNNEKSILLRRNQQKLLYVVSNFAKLFKIVEIVEIVDNTEELLDDTYRISDFCIMCKNAVTVEAA